MSNPIPAMTSNMPLERPVVVIDHQFCAQYPTDLVISTKILSLGENDFGVHDVNGTLIFKIKSKHLTMHDRRYLKDANDNILVTLHEKIMSAHKRWVAYRGESGEETDLLFSVKKSSMIQMKTQLDIYLGNNKAELNPDFKVKGSWKERSCTIFIGDGESKPIIAQMHRGHNLKTAMLDADNFAVTVYPNVDYAFIVALVVVLDEITD
ncbi:protein LURP-one-related 15-like [Euphorbia lathyris]|uniref:protein LURP-one-related 15-like n=1 Tax=Euphorbia lathyris TaxID=212925 RepID=UPI003313B184